MSDFTGKQVIIIGGSRGIGAAIVRRFASAGAKVTFTYLGSQKYRQGAGRGNWSKGRAGGQWG